MRRQASDNFKKEKVRCKLICFALNYVCGPQTLNKIKKNCYFKHFLYCENFCGSFKLLI